MRIMVIEGCDYKTAPVGGQLSFCKQLVQVFSPEELCIVGVSTSADEPVGLWYKKEVNSRIYDCFNLYRLDVRDKPAIPLRIMNFLSIIRYRSIIFNNNSYDLVFIQAPELMIGSTMFNCLPKRIAYFFHGVANPLNNPRYMWGKLFSKVFWSELMKSLKKSDYIFAAADSASIQKALGRYPNLTSKVIRFPTRYDDTVFCVKPVPIELVERYSAFNEVIITTGRINKVKGWDFTLESFHHYVRNVGLKNSCLIFVGGGEDEQKLKQKISDLELDSQVFITGFVGKEDVVGYLNLAHLYLVGSISEGWSIAMLEALSCGLPIVSTEVSGARELIQNGKNGFVCSARNVEHFSQAIEESLSAGKVINTLSLDIAKRYKVSALKEALLKIFLGN